MRSVDYLGEGPSDLLAARKLIQLAGGVIGNSYYRPTRGTGKARLDQRLSGLNAGVQHGRVVLVLRDLNGDAACAGDLVKKLLPERHADLVLRIAVRTAEAWYIADNAAYAEHCGMSPSLLPVQPEEEASIKKQLLEWAKTGTARRLQSHLAETRKRGVPDWAALGQWHAEFVKDYWDPTRAIKSGRAPSLGRALETLRHRVKYVSAQ